jgi:hypothetical protein
MNGLHGLIVNDHERSSLSLAIAFSPVITYEMLAGCCIIRIPTPDAYGAM